MDFRPLKTAALAAGVMLGAILPASASSALGRYFDATSTVLPDDFKLSLVEEVRYEDNMYSSGSGEQGGYIFSTGVSLEASRARGKFSYAVTGSVAYDHYHKHASELGTPVYSIVPTIRYDQGKWDIMLGGRFTYSHTVVDRALTQNNSLKEPRAKYFTSGVDATWNLNLNERWGLAVSGVYETIDYSDRFFSDEEYDKYGVTIAPYYAFSPKTKAGISFAYSWTEYDQVISKGNRYADSETKTVNAFVDYRITGKLSAHASAGAEFLNYNKTGDVESENTALFNAGLSLSYRAMSNLDLSLALARKHNDNSGATGGLQEDTEASFGAVWRINPKLSLTQSISNAWSDKKDGADNDNTSLSYNVSLAYQMTANLTIYGGYDYSNTDYRKTRFADADYSGNAYNLGVSYTF